MSYTRYGWVGNRISEEDMAAMYRMKLKSRKPITAMVAEAVSQYVREMNPVCKTELLRIGELARTKEVYLVCFERVGSCHRFLLVDMIKRAMIIEACRRMNLVKAGCDNIAKAPPVEA